MPDGRFSADFFYGDKPCRGCGGLQAYVGAPPLPSGYASGNWEGWFHLDKTREHFRSVGWYHLTPLPPEQEIQHA